MRGVAPLLVALFGVMLLDSVDADNRVTWQPGEAGNEAGDEAAGGRARIRYRLPASDRSRLAFAAEEAVRVMFAAGAREVLLPSEEPLGPLETPRFRTPDEAAFCRELAFAPETTVLGSSHAQGTLKMGDDPARAVVNARCESHHARNLVVCDSSSFPTSCGVNPMLSVMTLARYQARRIVAERTRYGL